MWVDVDVVLSLTDIVDQYGFPGLRRLSDNTFSHADADALGLRRMTNLEAHSQVIRAVIEQHDGKDAIVDDRTNQIGRSLQQCLEVKRRVQRIGESDKEFCLQGLDTHLYLRRG